MMLGHHGTVLLGDLVAAAFDSAEREGSDPAEVSRLATHALRFVLRRVRGRSVSLLDMADFAATPPRTSSRPHAL